MAEGRGGAREGAGRPPNTVRWAAGVAASEGLALFACPWVVRSMIDCALNGDVSAQRYLLDRVFGRMTDMTQPIASRAREIEKLVPEDFDPEAMLTAPWSEFTGRLGSGEWTTALAQRLGLEAMDVLHARAQRGCIQSLKIIVEQWLGVPILPMAARGGEMTEEETRERLVAICVEKGMEEAQARAFVMTKRGKEAGDGE